jgi:hypothetical protein
LDDCCHPLDHVYHEKILVFFQGLAQQLNNVGTLGIPVLFVQDSDDHFKYIVIWTVSIGNQELASRHHTDKIGSFFIIRVGSDRQSPKPSSWFRETELLGSRRVGFLILDKLLCQMSHVVIIQRGGFSVGRGKEALFLLARCRRYDRWRIILLRIIPPLAFAWFIRANAHDQQWNCL